MSTCKCGQPAFNCSCVFTHEEPFTYQDRLKLEQENKRLLEVLQPFADGYERAKKKDSWAASYTHADAPRKAYELLQALKESNDE